MTLYRGDHGTGAMPEWHASFNANVEAGTSTVHARGSLDLLTVELLRGTVEILISSGRVDVTLDLAELTSVDRTGLLMLGGLRHDLDHRGGSLTVTNARRAVQDDLRRAHLTDPGASG